MVNAHVAESDRVVLRTATPMTNSGNWRYSAALGEFTTSFLNGAQRSVNRKVQGSNPWSGAKSEYKNRLWAPRVRSYYSNRTATAYNDQL